MLRAQGEPETGRLNIARTELAQGCPACSLPMRPSLEWVDTCDGCGYMRSNLSPGGAALGGGFETLRRANFEVILDRLAKFKDPSGAHLLEVGCGLGWFLEAAQKRGMVVFGIEPGDDASVPQANGFTVDRGFFPGDLQQSRLFDVIIFNDVFEHIPEPVPVLKATEDLLAPGGLVILNLPSSGGVFFETAKLLKRFGVAGPFDRMWQRGLASPHMSYFNADNLAAMVGRHTSLKERDRLSLPSVSRSGLWKRIHITMSGPKAAVVFIGVWLASFVLSSLPADISVVIFEKK